MPKHTALKLQSGKQTSHIQAFVWSYITISAWELSILSLTSNQDIIGFPNQSKAFTNSKQNIWIFLIAGNVGSGWQLCMLRNFHWTFSLKWLYLKIELTMLHTCFLMTIYSTCTRCILTEFSFIYQILCSLGHGRKFIKDAPSACRINGHINHFDMKLVMFLINVEKKPKLLFWCIFFLKFCLKK